MTLKSLATDSIDFSSMRVSLVLRDFGDDPQVVTELIGIRPTRCGRVGDPLNGPAGQQTTRTVRRTYWSLHSRGDSTAQLSEHLSDILEQLGGATQNFSRLPAGTTATVLCTIIPDDDLPVLAISSQLMLRFGEIGVDLEIDIISVDGPEESE